MQKRGPPQVHWGLRDCIAQPMNSAAQATSEMLVERRY